jgi:hypothetical protein
MAYYYMLPELPHDITHVSFRCQNEQYLIATATKIRCKQALTEDEVRHLCFANRINFEYVTTRFT